LSSSRCAIHPGETPTKNGFAAQILDHGAVEASLPLRGWAVACDRKVGKARRGRQSQLATGRLSDRWRR
jgi:hypothetical protein